MEKIRIRDRKNSTATLLQTVLLIGIILVQRYTDPHLTFHFDADPDLDPNPDLLDNQNFFYFFSQRAGLYCFIQIPVVFGIRVIFAQ